MTIHGGGSRRREGDDRRRRLRLGLGRRRSPDVHDRRSPLRGRRRRCRRDDRCRHRDARGRVSLRVHVDDESGRKSCGAVPPGKPPEQEVATWITQMDPGNGFVANPGITNLDDTTDFTIGTQSALVETVGTGTPRTLAKHRHGADRLHRQGRTRLWLKLEGVEHLGDLEIQLGNGNLSQRVRVQPAHRSEPAVVHRGRLGLDRGAVDTRRRSPARRIARGSPTSWCASPTTRPATTCASTSTASRWSPRRRPRSPAASCRSRSTTTSRRWSIAGARSSPSTVPGDRVRHRRSGRRGPATRSSPICRRSTMNGWDISAHASTQVDHALNFTNLSPLEVEDDMVNTRAWLIANGFSGYDHCAYPSGEFTPDILALADTYFTSCRTIYTASRSCSRRRTRAGCASATSPRP